MAHLSVLETLESRVSVQCPHGSCQCARDTGEPGLSAHLSVLETLESRVSVQCARNSSQCTRDTGEPGLSAVLMTCTLEMDTYDHFSRHLLMSGHEICISFSL